ncbi:MAG TPA: SDR family oxidoreductase [Candidatus Limnocylindrales bacterium]
MSRPGEGPLAGRRAIVTGAGTGIGRGVGLALAEAGADVVFHGYRHLDGAAEAVAQARATGSNAAAIAADLADAGAVERLIAEAAHHLGGLDILVNNAGTTIRRDLTTTDLATWDSLFAVNVRAMFVAIRAGLPLLEQSDQAVVINMTSGHGLVSLPGYSAYAATKGAIIALTRQLAVELAPRQIRVNAIAPGYIDVPRHRDDPDFDPDLGRRYVPLGRSGRPEDIGGAAVFLASAAAAFVSGQVLFVDGATNAQMGFFPSRDPLDAAQAIPDLGGDAP